MELDQLQYHWNGMGAKDPLFAVLTQPGKENKGWQREEFLATGRGNVSAMIKRISQSGLTLKHGRALDFGCAVGRLTQALCEHFDEVDGIDIAPSMLRVAREWNQFGDRCRYHLNETDSLRLFDDQTFDFICTLITLQHMQPRFAANYISEFARILVPGGIVLFQVPDQRVELRAASNDVKPATEMNTSETNTSVLGRVKRWFQERWTPKQAEAVSPAFYMEMYCFPEADVVALLKSLGLNIVAVAQDSSAGSHFISKVYLAQRPLVAESREPTSDASPQLARAA